MSRVPNNPTEDEMREWYAVVDARHDEWWAEVANESWRDDPNLTEHDDPRAEHEAEGRKEARETGWRDDYDGRLADGAAANEFYNRGGAA